MKRTILYSICFILACSCSCSAVAQQIVTVQDEPKNLNTVKQELKQYYACVEASCYGPQLEHQADIAFSS